MSAPEALSAVPIFEKVSMRSSADISVPSSAVGSPSWPNGFSDPGATAALSGA